MKFLVGFIGLFAGLALLVASAANAQQPSIDIADIDEDDCVVTVEWIDGTQTALEVEVFINDIEAYDIDLNDVVGDQSIVVVTFKANAGDEILTSVDVAEEEDNNEVDLTVGTCPPPSTATPTATSTATSTPTATATPSATNTPSPTATPVIVQVPVIVPQPVVVERVVEKQVVVQSTVRPPSTGDGGLR